MGHTHSCPTVNNRFGKNCFACHDAKKRKGKLDMTTFENFRKGGDKSDPIAPGKPEESLILDLLGAKDNSRMPPKDSGEPLPAAKIAVIQQWIKEGAKLDAGLTPKSDLLRELRVRWKPPAPPATSVEVVYWRSSVSLVMPVSSRNSGVMAWIEAAMSRSEVLMRVPERVFVAR